MVERKRARWILISNKQHVAEKLEVDVPSVSTKRWPGHNSILAAKSFAHSSTPLLTHPFILPSSLGCGKQSSAGNQEPCLIGSAQPLAL